MSSLYEAVHGHHPHISLAVIALGVGGGFPIEDLNSKNPEAIEDVTAILSAFGRFRDAWFEIHGDSVRIRVLARVGGPNRLEHADVFVTMSMHPLFHSVTDEPYDSTYASFYFELPPKSVPPLLRMLKSQDMKPEEPVDMQAKWQAAIERVGEMPKQEIADLMQRVSAGTKVLTADGQETNLMDLAGGESSLLRDQA